MTDLLQAVQKHAASLASLGLAFYKPAASCFVQANFGFFCILQVLDSFRF